MAIALRSGRRHVTHRPPWVRRRANDDGARLALFMVALLSLVAAALVLSGQVLQVSIPRSLVPQSRPAVTNRPTDGAVPASKMLMAASVEQSAVAPPAAAETARVLAVGVQARVANTDGLGVVFYSAPRASARMPAGLLEGTPVTVLELADGEWARVRSDARHAGWVRAAYLTPAD
jgi:hypothetical protein